MKITLHIVTILVLIIALTGCSAYRSVRNSTISKNSSVQGLKDAAKGDFQNAKKIFDELIKNNPSFDTYSEIAVGLYQIGMDYKRSGKDGEYEKTMRMASDYLIDAKDKLKDINNDNKAILLSTLGMVSTELKDTQLTIDSYETAIKLSPNNMTYLNNYAYALANFNIKLDRALELSEKAYSANPSTAYIMDTYGWILVLTGKASEGGALIEESLRLESDFSGEVTYHLGYAYYKMNKKEEAILLLKEAEKRASETELSKKIKVLLSELLGTKGQDTVPSPAETPNDTRAEPKTEVF